MYSHGGGHGNHPGGLSLPGMVSHWTHDILSADPGNYDPSVSSLDVMSRFFVDIVFRQWMQEYIRQILVGEKTCQMLETELGAMRELFAVNWLNLKTDGKVFAANAHGHSLEDCYKNLNNPVYRHTGHNPAHHKCLWEYYLNQVIN